MTNEVLTVSNLTTMLRGSKNNHALVDKVSFCLKKGKTLALLGESGCGKSMTALSLLGLTPKPAVFVESGSVVLDGQDLLNYSEQQMRQVRGKRVSMIFQEPMTSLNPVMTVAQQIKEVFTQHEVNVDDMDNEVASILQSVGIPDAVQRQHDYPHQFSGGMKQRVMIALALATKPDILIADEPTTALDVTIQAQVLSLIKDMQAQTGMSILLITHDLGIVQQVADDIAIMYAGQMIESSSCEAFFKQPMHPYSQALFQAIPSIKNRTQALNVIDGMVPSLQQEFSECRFINRCAHAHEACQQLVELKTIGERQIRCVLEQPADIALTKQATQQGMDTSLDNAAEMISIKHLKTHFPIRKGLLKSIKGYVYAVDDVSFSIKKGETLALVGESGCGKTTVGKSILQMLKEANMSLSFNGKPVDVGSSKDKKLFHKKVQFIFQDPFSSMNPRLTIKQVMSEGLLSFTSLKGEALEQKIIELLAQVGIDETALDRYPHEFSGGQRQRICIARALAVEPEFIVCDEPTSALDVSVQAQILNLLKQLQRSSALSYLFITHNISVVSWLADKVAVMYLGRIVEYGTVEQILSHAKHPYTQALLSSVPDVHSNKTKKLSLLKGELPSPINLPSGCYFHPRCPQAHDRCLQEYPAQSEQGGHLVSCHLYP